MPDVPPSPHEAYDRYVRRMDRLGAWFASLVVIVFGIFAVAMTVTFVALLIVGILDLGEPRVWGTFTETSCEQTARHGCRSIGTWRSDDGAIVKRSVYLDGSPDRDGTARADYQPTGLNNDADNNIVHVAAFSAGAVWIPAVVLPLWIGYVVYKARSYGIISWPRRGRTRRPPAPGSRRSRRALSERGE